MRRLLPALTIPLFLAACGEGREAANVPDRDLSLVASTASARPAVLSDIERGHVAPRDAPARRRVKRTYQGVVAAVPAAGAAATGVVSADPAPGPAAPASDAAPAAPAPLPATGGLGEALAPGETVTIVPAVAMGGGVRGRRGDEGAGRRGDGIIIGIIGHDNCSPSRGSIIAVNRPYVGVRGSMRRF